jgi:hypothetical protein
MAERTVQRRTTAPRGVRGRWPELVGYATAVWSLLYGLLGVYWSLGGRGFPFAPVDEDRRSGSILEGADVHVLGPVIAVLGLLGAVLALIMARSGRTRATVAILVFGWAMAAVLTLIVPDYFLIALIAFSPALLVFTFTGVPGPQGGIGDIIYWHRINLLVMFVGGVLWAAASLVYYRRSRGACPYCGRIAGAHGGPSTETLHRWGRWAVLAALLAPLPYEITRIAWFLGIPLGATPEFLRMMQDTPGMLDVGLGLAGASAIGGVLTHGLVARWGEVYPRWIFWRAGRRVPPALAIVPASIVGVVLVPAGLMNVRMGVSRDSWALTGPSVLWILWGVALGAATYLYYLRRRGACRSCGEA